MFLKPTNPKLLLRWAGYLTGFFSTVGPLVYKGIQLKEPDLAEKLVDQFGHLLQQSWPLLLPFMLLSAFGTAVYFNWRWHGEVEENRKTKDENKNLDLKLTESERNRLLDPTTGIPNQIHLIDDMRRMAQDAGIKKREGHLLLIDIRGFKEINRTFGFEKADRLLRVIAQDLHKSMQRREDIYKKRPATDFTSLEVDPSVYRKYAGGDEFLFLINGNLSAALGYVNRQRKQFQILSKLTTDILGKHRDLSFQCGVARIFWPDADSAQLRLGSALDNVSECYIKALRVATPDKKFSICWDTNSELEDAKWPGFRATDIGKDIEEHFSVAAWGMGASPSQQQAVPAFRRRVPPGEWPR